MKGDLEHFQQPRAEYRTRSPSTKFIQGLMGPAVSCFLGSALGLAPLRSETLAKCHDCLSCSTCKMGVTTMVLPLWVVLRIKCENANATLNIRLAHARSVSLRYCHCSACSTLNSNPQTHSYQEPQNTTLFGNSIFADVTNIRIEKRS